MKCVILIPWRQSPGRDQNLARVLNHYAPLEMPVVYGDSGEVPFNRGASRNMAADRAGKWDVALISDADCMADLEVVRKAFLLAEATGKLILPHDDLYRLTRRGTPRFDQTQPWGPQLDHLCGLRWGRPKAPSGALVIARETFQAVRYDDRFVGWGWEDTTFLVDAERIAGVIRLAGPLVHLWHPRDPSGMDGGNEAVYAGHLSGIG